MINILIVDNDLKYAVKLMNKLNEKNSNIRIANIVQTKRETISILNKNRDIDYIILALNMNNSEKENFLKQIKKTNYIGKIIWGLLGTYNTSNKEGVYKNIKENSTNNSVLKINELIQKKEADKERAKIKEQLSYLKYDFSLKGTQYLIEAITVVARGNYSEIYTLEKDIYPVIKTIYGDSVHNIKNNINRANNNMYLKCEIEKLKKYFKFSTDEKPKTKLIINTILNKLSN